MERESGLSAQDELQAATARAKQAARDAGANARQAARSYGEAQKRSAAEGMSGLAAALHSAARQLENTPSGALAPFVEQAAERIDDASQRLREEDLSALLARAEGLARRQPMVFIGGSIVLGFAVARMLKNRSS